MQRDDSKYGCALGCRGIFRTISALRNHWVANKCPEMRNALPPEYGSWDATVNIRVTLSTSYTKLFQRLIKEITTAVVRISQATDAVVEETAPTEAPCKNLAFVHKYRFSSYIDSCSNVATTPYTFSSISSSMSSLMA